MTDRTVDIHDAKTQLSRVIARVEQGDGIVIARAGRPVAELRPPRKLRKRSKPLDDPLLRVNEYSYVADVDIDRTMSSHATSAASCDRYGLHRRYSGRVVCGKSRGFRSTITAHTLCLE